MVSKLRIPRAGIAQILTTTYCLAGALSAQAGRPAEILRPSPLVAAADPPAPAAGAEPAPAANAEAAATPESARPPAPSQNAMVNLINRLVRHGVLKEEDATELTSLAEADAAAARAQAAAEREVVLDAARDAQMAAQMVSLQQQATAPTPGMQPPAEDAVRVTYIPEVVKAELREQIKQEVMNKAKDENWAAPRKFPEWTSRFRFMGDVRVRYEGNFYPAGNDNTGGYPNFAAINTGRPFDVTGSLFSPQLNTDADRQRVRLRARLGAEVTLTDGFSAGIRIATGNDNSPVTANQTLGQANQSQGGNFSKYALWLDRGFLKYETGPGLNRNFGLVAGRFDNPFFTVSEIQWDDDVGFDGIAAFGKYEFTEKVSTFFSGGAFPIFNTDLNFATNQPSKFSSYDKWLYAGQIGTDLKITKDLNLKLGVAYYYFQNAEGRLSDPFVPLTTDDNGNTDNSRPSFAQKGNTYMPLRRIVASPLNNFGTTNQFQYFGLATPFRNLSLTGRLDYTRFEPVTISLMGEWVKNLAFSGNSIESKAINNRGSTVGAAGVGPYSGGDTAWFVGLRLGSAALQKRGDWLAGISYRYVESDAVIDGFTDSDFGLGGTNLKGYTVSGALALSPNVNVALRWMSSDQIAGPPLKVDVLLIDLNGKF